MCNVMVKSMKILGNLTILSLKSLPSYFMCGGGGGDDEGLTFSAPSSYG
jgi:hypothetical protein